MAIYSIANEVFFEKIKQLLDEGKTVYIRVRGDSMRPFLHTDDLVLLAPASTEKLEIGKIVLANTADKKTVLHRIYRMSYNRIYLMGDRNIQQQEMVSENDILGVATHILNREKHQKVSLYTNGQRLKVFVWRKMLFCRKALLFIIKTMQL